MNSNDLTSSNPTQDLPRIYVASLSDYNAGRLHGRWIDANQPEVAIRAEIADMLAESRELVAEEWAIHDYDNFAGLRLSEFEDLDRVSAVAALIAQHGTLFAKLMEHFGGMSGLEDARRCMEEGSRGAYESLAHYAQELVEECYGDAIERLPAFIRGHIDYDGIGRDLELGGDIFTVECGGAVHVFDSTI